MVPVTRKYYFKTLSHLTPESYVGNGSYTLHGTGNRTGTGMDTIENNGVLYLSLSSVYSTRCNIETDHFLIPVPATCSVNEP